MPGVRELVEEGGWVGRKVGARSQATRMPFSFFPTHRPLWVTLSHCDKEKDPWQKRGQTNQLHKADDTHLPEDMYQKVPRSTIQNRFKPETIQLCTQWNA